MVQWNPSDTERVFVCLFVCSPMFTFVCFNMGDIVSYLPMGIVQQKIKNDDESGDNFKNNI